MAASDKALGGFTARYDVNRLMYYEFYETIEAAIAREKQIKGLAAQEEARADRANES